MRDEYILLLDHRVRDISFYDNHRLMMSGAEGTSLAESNHLLTGKKGGGSSKRLTELLMKHGLPD